MAAIETGIHAQFASLQSTPTSASAQSRSQSQITTSTLPADLLNGEEPTPSTARPALVETPFAKVSSVAPGSPASSAGLKAGDTVRAFGDVNWMNHENLAGVARVVGGSEGVSFYSHYINLLMEGWFVSWERNGW